MESDTQVTVRANGPLFAWKGVSSNEKDDDANGEDIKNLKALET